MVKSYLERYWPILLGWGAYSILAAQLNFTQDDAYISYRFVANYLNGDGLVYNIGEHVEGFTNFGWVVMMTFWGALGISYIFMSKLIGFLCGAGVVAVTYLIALHVFDKNRMYSTLATVLVGLNQSLAYWSPAGLETSAFSLVVMLSVLCYLKRSWWLIFTLVMAVWIRPEGALVAALLMLVESLRVKGLPRYTISAAIIALAFSLPFVAFKIYYYGGLLPNPFYAKTGLSAEKLSSGIEYVWTFLKHYGFYGLGFVITILGARRLTTGARAVLVFAVAYIAYIVLVGGDVLKVHRFFLPLFGLCAIVAAGALAVLFGRLHKKTELMLVVSVGLVMAISTYVMPKENVDYFHHYETGFTKRMKWMAENLKASDSTDFSVALPTIGIFGYELVGHKIIDMVGLTDSTIARHSEEPIEGMKTTWKETKHNSAYLLRSAPDYIMFSTGNKPSAPAERALLLYRQFQDSYRTRGWFYRSDTTRPYGVMSNVFKKVRAVTGELAPVYPVEFVEHFKTGLDQYVKRDYQSALREFLQAIRASPQPYYGDLLYQTGFCYFKLQEHEKAKRILDQVVAQDSLEYEAHRALYLYAKLENQNEKAAVHSRWIQKLVPWYWPIVEKDTEATVRETRRRAGQQPSN